MLIMTTGTFSSQLNDPVLSLTGQGYRAAPGFYKYLIPTGFMDCSFAHNGKGMNFFHDNLNSIDQNYMLTPSSRRDKIFIERRTQISKFVPQGQNK